MDNRLQTNEQIFSHWQHGLGENESATIGRADQGYGLTRS